VQYRSANLGQKELPQHLGGGSVLRSEHLESKMVGRGEEGEERRVRSVRKGLRQERKGARASE